MYYFDTLSNGIKLIIVPVKNMKTATALILFSVGSRYEPEGLNGASHFIEHMMFKGTKKRPSSWAVARDLDKIGAQYNAFTAKDHTGYWVKTLSEKIEIGLDVLSDILFNSVFDSQEFEQEKGVIIEETKMYRENPLLYIEDFFESVLFQRHQLGKFISGEISDIQKLKREKLLIYKRKFYQPGQMLIVIAGDIKQNQAFKLVKKYFGKQKNKKIKNYYSPFKPQRAGPEVKIMFKDLKQVQVAIGGYAYAYNHPDRLSGLLLSNILGGNMSSCLFTEVRVKRGLAYSVRMDMESYQDVGNYLIQAGVDRDKVFETIKVVLSELSKIKNQEISQEELSRAQDFFKGSLRIYLEDSAALANWYGLQMLLTKKIYTPKQILEKIKKIKIKNIQQTAKRLFVNQGLKLAVIGPFKRENSLLRVLNKGL